MPTPTPNELKKALQARGFEVYRTTKEEIVLADRVRENLLMDSAVAVRTGENLAVRLTIRAEAAEFPGAAEEELFVKARRLAEPALLRGFRETGTKVVPVYDPGDRARTLDTWYEVWLERAVASFDELEQELRAALSFDKVARSLALPAISPR